MLTRPNISSSRREESRVYEAQSRHRLSRDAIILLLAVLERKLYNRRGGEQTKLVVHGGVIFVLRGLRPVTTTIDYIADTLPKELREMIKECIAEVEHEYRARVERLFGIKLERDWMNSNAEIILPPRVQ